MSFEVFLFCAILIYIVCVSVYSDLKQPRGTAIIRSTTENIEDLLSHRTVADLDYLHEYAVLSAASYGSKEYSEIVKDSTDMNGLWKLVLREHTKSTIDRSITEGVTGLVYQVYRRAKKTENDKDVFAIVFRGTDNLIDFESNLHWIAKFIPGKKDQYDFVRENTRDIVTKINELSLDSAENVQVVSAGHSLGGGLAQQAAYAAEGVNTVFAYAPSAVTGFYDVDAEQRNERKKNIRIFRIHERGEVLAYMRRFMKTIFPVVQVNPKIVEIRFNFQDLSTDLIDLHGIGPLALNLMDAWEKRV